jgi:hypothetical protein
VTDLTTIATQACPCGHKIQFCHREAAARWCPPHTELSETQRQAVIQSVENDIAARGDDPDLADATPILESALAKLKGQR